MSFWKRFLGRRKPYGITAVDVVAYRRDFGIDDFDEGKEPARTSCSFGSRSSPPLSWGWPGTITVPWQPVQTDAPIWT